MQRYQVVKADTSAQMPREIKWSLAQEHASHSWAFQVRIWPMFHWSKSFIWWPMLKWTKPKYYPDEKIGPLNRTIHCECEQLHPLLVYLQSKGLDSSFKEIFGALDLSMVELIGSRMWNSDPSHIFWLRIIEFLIEFNTTSYIETTYQMYRFLLFHLEFTFNF